MVQRHAHRLAVAGETWVHWAIVEKSMRTIEVKPVALKIERRGIFGDYEVSGWRYVDDISWNLKVWLAGRPRDWLGYTMTSGQCELNILNEAQRSALAQVIANWEA
jgi:hypothetical protein